MNKIYDDVKVLITVCLINRGTSTTKDIFEYVSSIAKGVGTLKELNMCLANMENEKLITKKKESSSTEYSVLKTGECFYKAKREEFKKTLVRLNSFYFGCGDQYEV